MSDKGYTITDSREIQTLTESGKTVTMNRVWITTDRGATGTVDVLKKDWTAAKLESVLALKAAELDLAFVISES
jgi:hypothetical protein